MLKRDELEKKYRAQFGDDWDTLYPFFLITFAHHAKHHGQHNDAKEAIELHQKLVKKG